MNYFIEPRKPVMKGKSSLYELDNSKTLRQSSVLIVYGTHTRELALESRIDLLPGLFICNDMLGSWL